MPRAENEEAGDASPATTCSAPRQKAEKLRSVHRHDSWFPLVLVGEEQCLECTALGRRGRNGGDPKGKGVGSGDAEETLESRASDLAEKSAEWCEFIVFGVQKALVRLARGGKRIAPIQTQRAVCQVLRISFCET